MMLSLTFTLSKYNNDLSHLYISFTVKLIVCFFSQLCSGLNLGPCAY